MDCEFCVNCQQETAEKLVDPALGKHRESDKQCGYTLFAQNIWDFRETNCLPQEANIERFDNGEYIENTLQANKAVWQKTYRNRFDTHKVKCAQKEGQRGDRI